MGKGQALDFWLSGFTCALGMVGMHGHHYGFAAFAFAVSALCFYAGAKGLD